MSSDDSIIVMSAVGCPLLEIGFHHRPPLVSFKRVFIRLVGGSLLLYLSIGGRDSSALGSQRPSILRALWPLHCQLNKLFVWVSRWFMFLSVILISVSILYKNTSEHSPFHTSLSNSEPIYQVGPLIEK